MRNVLVAKKQLQDRNSTKGNGSKPGADDGVVTTQDIRKGTLGHKPVQPSPSSPTDGDTSKPSDSQIDIYV
jgi:hypothetical protein